jgi:hypothetical protein
MLVNLLYTMTVQFRFQISILLENTAVQFILKTCNFLFGFLILKKENQILAIST